MERAGVLNGLYTQCKNMTVDYHLILPVWGMFNHLKSFGEINSEIFFSYRNILGERSLFYPVCIIGGIVFLLFYLAEEVPYYQRGKRQQQGLQYTSVSCCQTAPSLLIDNHSHLIWRRSNTQSIFVPPIRKPSVVAERSFITMYFLLQEYLTSWIPGHHG
jgi:hypothetical protein